MNNADIEALRHWSFTQLFEDNRQRIFEPLYRDTYTDIEQNIGRPPAEIDMENALHGQILGESRFVQHCDSKNSYNPSFNVVWAKKFAQYLVFMFYIVP